MPARPFVLVFSLLLVACQSPSSEPAAVESGKMAATMSSPILNTTCPMMSDMEIDEEETVDYGAGRVAFCCGGCAAKWNSLDDAGKAEALGRVRR